MNTVPIIFLIRCVSFVYGEFCEGCECKKIKTPVTRARESRHQDNVLLMGVCYNSCYARA